MNLHEIRSLRGQLIATAGLFGVCLPAAIAVLWMRPKFEEYMIERYSISYSQFDEQLKSLSDAADCGLTDLCCADDDSDDERLARVEAREEIAGQDQQHMECLYQDCIQRRAQGRARVFQSLVSAAPEFFLYRAEQTVVCGNAEQRAAGLELLELSGHPQALVKLERLRKWAEARRIPELPEQIDAAAGRIKAKGAGR